MSRGQKIGRDLIDSKGYIVAIEAIYNPIIKVAKGYTVYMENNIIYIIIIES